jgi:magnesium chelatase family protein
VLRYRSRVSGPLLDRIDLHVEVPRPLPADLAAPPDGEPSAVVAARVAIARALQLERAGCVNARLGPRELDRDCVPERAALRLLERAASQLGLSARACHRCLRLARSIADLAEAETIALTHVGEALSLRCLDRPVP